MAGSLTSTASTTRAGGRAWWGEIRQQGGGRSVEMEKEKGEQGEDKTHQKKSVRALYKRRKQKGWRRKSHMVFALSQYLCLISKNP